MTHVLFTCPSDLLCNMGLYVSHDEPDNARLVDTLSELGSAIVRDGDNRIAVRLADPLDTIIAMRTLATELPDHDIELMSFVASAFACEMFLEQTEPARSAWLWLCARLDGPRPDPRNGCCFVNRAVVPRSHDVPHAIAQQQLPGGSGLVIWAVEANTVYLVTDSPHFLDDAAQFERSQTGWLVRNKAQGISVDNQFRTTEYGLQPGMVITLPTDALVVLAVQ